MVVQKKGLKKMVWEIENAMTAKKSSKAAQTRREPRKRTRIYIHITDDDVTPSLRSHTMCLHVTV